MKWEEWDIFSYSACGPSPKYKIYIIVTSSYEDFTTSDMFVCLCLFKNDKKYTKGYWNPKVEAVMRELSEININGLHVGDLGQGGVDAGHEGGHGEHGGHPQPPPGRGRASVEPEAHPGHHHDQTARDVNLQSKEIEIPLTRNQYNFNFPIFLTNFPASKQ